MKSIVKNRKQIKKDIKIQKGAFEIELLIKNNKMSCEDVDLLINMGLDKKIVERWKELQKLKPTSPQTEVANLELIKQYSAALDQKTEIVNFKKKIPFSIENKSKTSDRDVKLDPFDSTIMGNGIPNFLVDPNINFPPLATEQEITELNRVYNENPQLHKDVIGELKRQNLEQRKKDIASIMGKSAANELNNISSTTTAVGISDYNLDGSPKNQYASISSDGDHSWIQTFTKEKLFPLNPDPATINIRDIAHALSMQCRFTGHSCDFYSVAQHSVLVSYLCDEKDALHGLLHDSSEYALADLSSPLKRSGKFPDYIACEKKLQEAIYHKFGLSEIEPASVKKADLLALSTESRDFMAPFHKDWNLKIQPIPFRLESWEPRRAEKEFLKRFQQLIDLEKSL